MTPPAGTLTDLSRSVTTEQTGLRKQAPDGETLAEIAAGSPLVNLLGMPKVDGWVAVGCWRSERLTDDNALVGYVKRSAVKSKA